MEYQNTDDAIRIEACEKVKQIVKAIKAIKIKYYLIFSKISAKDRETYQKLEKSLEKISEEHNLNSLKVALMKEIDDKKIGKMLLSWLGRILIKCLYYLKPPIDST